MTVVWCVRTELARARVPAARGPTFLEFGSTTTTSGCSIRHKTNNSALVLVLVLVLLLLVLLLLAVVVVVVASVWKFAKPAAEA